MAASGSHSRRLVRCTVTLGAPGAWSPDGKRIAYVGRGTKGPDLFVMSAEGSTPKQLTDTDEMEAAVQWTANGRGILFTRVRSFALGFPEHPAIYIFDTRTGREKKLMEEAWTSGSLYSTVLSYTLIGFHIQRAEDARELLAASQRAVETPSAKAVNG